MLYYIIMKIGMEHIILNKWDRKMRYCCYIKPTNQLRTISSGSLEIAPARSLQLTHGPACPYNPPDHEKEPATSMYTQETIKQNHHLLHGLPTNAGQELLNSMLEKD
jgi:hypothetical protein